MALRQRRAALSLDGETRLELLRISCSGTGQAQRVMRAGMLLDYASEMGTSEIARVLNTTRKTVYRCVDKALDMGSLDGRPSSGRKPSIIPKLAHVALRTPPMPDGLLKLNLA